MRGLITVLCGTVLAVAGPLPAEELAPLPLGDFTFHRVHAPPPGQAPKITVQVDPAAYAAWMAGKGKGGAEGNDTPVATAAAMAPTGWEWFWATVSTDLTDAGAANMSKALAALNTGQGPAPRLQTLKRIATKYGRDILVATVGTDVSPALVLALIAVESSGQTAAESAKGAQGLMQLVPDTAARFGVADPTDPAQSIKGGVAYLAWLMKHFNGDIIMTLAGYNAGENAVTANGGVPPFAETRAYVPKVLAAWQVARGLCLTPPELVTDGCVFAVQG